MVAQGEMAGNDEVDFHHPYTPYDVQLDFMKTAYGVMQQGEGQIGILESPTGTGKSLSLICSALTWLRNFKKSQFEISLDDAAQGFKDEPAWVIDQILRRKRDELIVQWDEREERLRRIRDREKQRETRVATKKRRLEEPGGQRIKAKNIDEESEFLVDDWNGDDSVDDKNPLSQLSRETRAILKEMGMGIPDSNPKGDDDENVEDEIKIFYTSRTHSQLTQFISELRRPSFPPSFPTTQSTTGTDRTDNGHEGIKHVPLSSRQRLCINPGVTRLGSVSAINDRCSELQQPKSKDKCAFIPSAEKISQTHQFRDTTLATLPDIEDLHQLGKSLQVCPYYASRTAIPGAEVITLPYPLLLQKSAREALGIKLEGNIVIIDEAHNIMDAVANVHAAEIRLTDLIRARQMLGGYVKRFGKKLKGENRVMIGQLAKVVDGLREWLNFAQQAKASQGIVESSDLLRHKGADQINLFRLVRYIQESKLAFKVESYATHAEEQEKPEMSKPASLTPVLHALVSFLLALTNLSTEGRIFYEKSASPSTDVTLSYLLLSPTHAFSSIASSARAVILAGGTMSPFDDYKAHLFPYMASSKITTLSCGHVIPPSNLCVWTLASSRPGTTSGPDSFEFSFQRRSDVKMVRQLGLALLNICSFVPDGVVVFFPSYGYLEEVVGIWQRPETQASTKPIWDRLQEKKAVFRETKGGSSDETLAQYSEAILSDVTDAIKGSIKHGALLLSVVGGKMSEGINFSDRLGRCVVVVGLPYPNINSPEWKARIEYIESSTLARLTSPADQGDTDTPASKTPVPREQAIAASKQAARDFYENACMRAVNQSIGRAIRHRNDYAAIVLVDRRFGTERTKGKLPGWIRGGMVKGSEEKGLPGLMGALSGFFRGKKDS